MTNSVCTSCNQVPAGFFQRYRGFLTAPGTLIAAANILLLGLGAAISLLSQPAIGRWFYLASALVGGAPIFILAWRNIWRKFDLTAGVMVSIAMLAALIVGEYSAAALVATMMLAGEMLENWTVARADDAQRDLESLVPERVTLRRGDQDVEVLLSRIRPGDHVLVRPGARLPVDGIVDRGSAAVDQAAITGESLPVDKEPGDSVYAGTLNTAGSLEVVVEQVGATTTLGQMIELVRQARNTQAPVQRVANHYAQYLTPLALLIALITYALTRDVIRSITVLIVICPCSLVLTTPTAVVAAIGNAARRGILVKHGPAMEQVGKVQVVAFDKTGTLTLGQPGVQHVLALNGASPTEILALTASAERASEHPLGQAILAAAQAQALPTYPAEDFETLPGHGIQAAVQGRRITVGQRMLDEHQIPLSGEQKATIADLQAQGKTVVPVAIDGELSGLIVVTDTVRPESKQAVARLKELGVDQVLLISGDNRAVAQAVGDELGVDRVYADILPEKKLALIHDLQAQGHTVAFVGDGVNDAPALAAANVGIAMGGMGTHIAMQTADIVLLTDRLERLPDLIDLSRTALRTIRNNVLFAMSMNVLSVGLSIGGIIGPVVGAVMHEASALPVIANSARLIGRRPRLEYKKA